MIDRSHLSEASASAAAHLLQPLTSLDCGEAFLRDPGQRPKLPGFSIVEQQLHFPTACRMSEFLILSPSQPLISHAYIHELVLSLITHSSWPKGNSQNVDRLIKWVFPCSSALCNTTCLSFAPFSLILQTHPKILELPAIGWESQKLRIFS